MNFKLSQNSMKHLGITRALKTVRSKKPVVRQHIYTVMRKNKEGKLNKKYFKLAFIFSFCLRYEGPKFCKIQKIRNSTFSYGINR